MRKTGLGRAYVRKWVYLSELRTRNRMAPRPGMPDLHRVHLQRRWARAVRAAVSSWPKSKRSGTSGATPGWPGCWRRGVIRCPPGETRQPGPTRATTVRHRRPWCAFGTSHPRLPPQLLSQPRGLRSERQAATVDVLKQQYPGFTRMRRLVLSFRAILRHGEVATLRRWMRRARASNIHALQRFVRTLRQDLGARGRGRGATGPWKATSID
jgi:hypothetical protein